MYNWQGLIDSFSSIHGNTPSLGVWIGFGIVLVLLLCSGFVSASEIAFFSLKPSDRSNIDEGRHKADEKVASLLGDEHYDIILANINRNILLQDIPQYVRCMNDGALLFLSGFYEEDLPALRYCCAQNGMRYLDHKVKDKWVAARFERI